METKMPIGREDEDPLVMAATRVCASGNVYRRPGVLQFTMVAGDGGSEIIVSRSRFDGTYGNICRVMMTEGGRDLPLTFVPVSEVLAVMTKPDGHVCNMARVYKEWIAKGKR